LIVCWGFIFLYFSKIIEETSHYPVSEIVLYTMIATMSVVFLGGLRFSGWILSKKGDREEIDMGKVKPFPKDYGDFCKTIKAK